MNKREMDTNEATRKRSGTVDGDAIEGLLYTLVRDGHVSPSALETAACDINEPTCSFTNGWLAAYVKDVVYRLKQTKLVLVWSNEHCAWWAPDHRGYVRDVAAAGEYTQVMAERICRDAGMLEDGRPSECIVPKDVRR